MEKNTFDEFEIMRGKRSDENSLFSKIMGDSNGSKV